MTAKFWAVVKSDQYPMQFTYKHESEELARVEAERLARRFPGSTFFLMELRGTVRLPEPPVEWSMPEQATEPTADTPLAEALALSSIGNFVVRDDEELDEEICF